MARPYMGDIYRYLTTGEGKVIGNLSYSGDKLCRKIVNRYMVHFQDQRCEDAAKELRDVLKEYVARIRIEERKWPTNAPISLRSYVGIAQTQEKKYYEK